MVKKKQGRFNGFSPAALNFLRNLDANNNKIWFEAHKQEYQKYLLEPLRNLVTDMGEFMLAIDPWFELRPAINKTISRIYRDTRFSRDKAPCKNTMWITFKRPGRNWRDAPAYFFEISPDSYRYGMGFYSASKDTMDKFRETIDKEPKEFLEATSFYPKQQDFVVEGEKYNGYWMKLSLETSKTGISGETYIWFALERLIIAFSAENLSMIWSWALAFLPRFIIIFGK